MSRRIRATILKKRKKEEEEKTTNFYSELYKIEIIRGTTLIDRNRCREHFSATQARKKKISRNIFRGIISVHTLPQIIYLETFVSFILLYTRNIAVSGDFTGGVFSSSLMRNTAAMKV